jgi:hypothetical protein
MLGSDTSFAEEHAMIKPDATSKSGHDTHVEVIETIRRRHAVRSFEQQKVEEAAIRTLLDAAVLAPTAVHEEPWAFAIIQDGATLRRLSDKAKEGMNETWHSLHVQGHPPSNFVPPENIFYDAGTLIVIYGKPMGPFVVADCWLAAENLMLAACSMGLGTCVIGLAVSALNTPEWKAELNAAPDMTAFAPIIVGVPRTGRTLPTSRKAPEILAWK